MSAEPLIVFPLALLVLVVIGGLVIWGLVAFFCKFGIGKSLLAVLLLLPAIAVGAILLSLVSYRSQPVPAVEYRAIDHQRAIDQEAERLGQMAEARAEQVRQMAEARAEHGRQMAEAHAEHGRQMAQAARERSLASGEATPQIQLLDPLEPVIIPQPAVSTSVSLPNTTVPATPEWMFLAAVAVVAMLVLSGMIGTSVYLAAQGGTLQWRAVGSKLLSIVWVIPVLIMAAIPMYMAAGKLGGWTVPSIVSPTLAPVVETRANADRAATTGGLPDWVNVPQHTDGQTRVVVVSSRYSPAVDASDTDRAISIAQIEVYNEAARQIRAYFGETYPVQGNWPIPDEIVRRAIGNVHLMEKDVDGGGKIYRRFAQVKLTPDIRQQLLPQWQTATTHSRLWALCAGLGVMTLLMGTTAGYLRLDRMTDGAYRGRLKLASLSVISAGALIAGMLVS